MVSSLSDLLDAIDLSHNHITSFPSLKASSSSTGLLALDISFNLLQRPIARLSSMGTGPSPSSSPMSSLVELNLSNNRISE